MKQFLSIALAGIILANVGYCAVVPGQTSQTYQPARGGDTSRPDMTSSPDQDYKLGTGDQISLSVSGLDDEYTDKVFRVDGTGSVSLPLIGRVPATGKTPSELERDLAVRLEPMLKDPQPVVTIVSFGSEPVSVLGAVRYPGIVQLQGHKTLFDTLSLAGGLDPDAGSTAEISRPLKNGPLPLANAQTDEATGVSIASIRLKDIINKPSATQNIQIMPGDTIAIPKTGLVYAVGSVTKPGGFPLNDNETLSALQVLALAEGLMPVSAPNKARILREVPGGTQRTEIPVDLRRLSSGQAPDVQLIPGDILFVPGSAAKKAGLRSIEAILNAATYASVYAAH